jgi:hypothetical protein
MGLNETATFELVLRPDATPAEVETEISSPGPTEQAEVRTTCATTAELTGHGFDVLPQTEETQFVCAGQGARWQWQVTALERGAQALTLTLSAQIANNPPVTVRVFSADIEVQVGLWRTVFDPVARNFSKGAGAFVVALGAAAGGWVWSRARRQDGG